MEEIKKHKCFISFKMEDKDYKKNIQDMGIDMIDKSLNDRINSYDPDYIMKKIRQDYLSDSTVTIHLIGAYSAENSFLQDQYYIKKELQASLYNGSGNTRSGILGVVLPSMTNNIFQGDYNCSTCGGTHGLINVNDNTVIKEFSYNYFIPHGKCCWTEDDRYCVLVKWENFKSDPEKYIHQAFKKREEPIANKVRVYPK